MFTSARIATRIYELVRPTSVPDAAEPATDAPPVPGLPDAGPLDGELDDEQAASSAIAATAAAAIPLFFRFMMFRLYNETDGKDCVFGR